MLKALENKIEEAIKMPVLVSYRDEDDDTPAHIEISVPLIDYKGNINDLRTKLANSIDYKKYHLLNVQEHDFIVIQLVEL